MAVQTFEGIIENGQIRLREQIRLPENAKVYVVIPDVVEAPPSRIVSPRLADPSQAKDFVKQVREEPEDAGV